MVLAKIWSNLASLAKWFSVRLRTKWLWVRGLAIWPFGQSLAKIWPFHQNGLLGQMFECSFMN